MLGNVLPVLHTLSAWPSLPVHVIPDTLVNVLPVSRILLSSNPALLGCHYLSVVCNMDRAWSGPRYCTVVLAHKGYMSISNLVRLRIRIVIEQSLLSIP
jgi:hypothetical protein